MSIKNTAKFAILNAIYSYIGKVVSYIFTALAFMIIVRSLSVIDYGRYTFYINAVFFVTLLLDFGMAEVILRYVPEYVEKNEISTVKWLLRKTIILISVACAITILVSVIFMYFFPSVTFRFQLSGILPYIILFGWLRIIMLILGNVLNAFFVQSYRIICEVGISAIRLFFIYLLLKKGFDVWTLIVLYGLLDLAIIFVFYLKIENLFKRVVAKSKATDLSRMRYFAINEYFYRLLWFFTDNRFDIYLVGIILGLTPAGYFAFAAGIVNLLIDWSPGLIIRPVVAPLFIKAYSVKKDIGQIQYLFKLHSKFLIFITLPIFLFIAIIFDKAIIYVFSPKYLPSLNVFLLFIASMFLINILIPLRNIIAIMERSDISNFTNIVAIPKIILIFLFAKSTGIVGVAFICAVSYIAIIWINIWLINKDIKLSFPWNGLFKIAVNSGIMGAVVYFLRPVVVNIITLFLVFGCGLAAYLLAAYLNKAFDYKERDLFNRAFKVRIWCF